MTLDPQMTGNELPHIAVCICTYQRPALLRRLLSELSGQETLGLFTYSVVVADNDCLASAEAVVDGAAAASPILIGYCVEPRQNIALTRNKALQNATGDYVAFIDDDEFPAKDWLLNLFRACNAYDVDGVLGPVKRHFDEEPPQWVVKGKFYERPTYPTGLVIQWGMGRTNNVLLKRSLFSTSTQPFRPQFRTGEDQDFFRRMIEDGHRFIWCNEAVAHEIVPPIRWKRSFMLRRALLQGSVSVLHPSFGPMDIAKSLVAIPGYTAALPVAMLLGHHRLMSLLIKLCDHLGRLLALVGVDPVKEPYVTG
jgi:glycosyltransferase involved in cell wall biosynthesis